MIVSENIDQTVAKAFYEYEHSSSYFQNNAYLFDFFY